MVQPGTIASSAGLLEADRLLPGQPSGPSRGASRETGRGPASKTRNEPRLEAANATNECRGGCHLKTGRSVSEWVKHFMRNHLQLKTQHMSSEKAVYDRILHEAWVELKPVYADFSIENNEPPKSFKELLAPLVSVPLREGELEPSE